MPPRPETTPNEIVTNVKAAKNLGETLPTGIQRGPSGFTRNFGDVGVARAVVAPATANVDNLMDNWKKIKAGPQDEAEARAYFSGPAFEQILSGNVPLWMLNDPKWRLFLARAGIIKKRLADKE